VRVYRLTTHAEDQMRHRKIAENFVRQVVNAPDQFSPDYSQKSYCLVKRFGTRLLKVWVLPPWPPAGGGAEIVVKSAAWKD